MSINLHVNLQVSIADIATASATFGVPAFIAEHAITANRQDGPYSSKAAAEADGFTLAAAPAINAWLTAWESQRPRASQVIIGRKDAGEDLPTALAAIVADDPAAFYAIEYEGNTADDIMAVATFTETLQKIAVVQTSASEALAGTASTAQVEEVTVGGTATDGVYSIAVKNNWTEATIGTASVTRATTPATNDDIAAALETAWNNDANLPSIGTVGVVGSVITITFTGLGNSYTLTLNAPAPGTLTDTGGSAPVQNPAELLSAGNFNRTAMVYHDDDTEYLDGAWSARCLGFNLDAPGGAGSWAYHRLSGITATRLTDPQKTQLIADNVNFYSPVRYTSGVDEAGFTFPGVMASGRFIDVTTTLDLTQARQEEALLGVFLTAAASSNPKVAYTDQGIARFQAAALRVLTSLGNAGHYTNGAESSVTGRRCPYIDAPKAADVSTNDKGQRVLTLSGEAVLAGAIHSVGNAATVGFTIDVVL